MTKLEQVLDLARWAPSGDNTQPWRFAIAAPDHIVVFGHDTRSHCVYDLDGHPSQISIGALLETLAISATQLGMTADIARRPEAPDEHPIFDVRLRSHAGPIDPLAMHVRTRTVQRRPLRLRRLAAAHKATLEGAAARCDIALLWLETWSARAKVAWINFRNAEIRLTIPEAYRVHREVIDWDARFSESRMPGQALGAGPMTLALMRWAMESWNRVQFLNRFFAGTLAPRIELDVVPSLACAAHCAFLAERPPSTLDDYVAAGRALQRFWLTATGLGLQFQPEYTPLVFARYARERRRFSVNDRGLRRADEIRRLLDRLLGQDGAARAMFFGRIGYGPPAASRSLRLPLEQLMERTPSPVTSP